MRCTNVVAVVAVFQCYTLMINDPFRLHAISGRRTVSIHQEDVAVVSYSTSPCRTVDYVL